MLIGNALINFYITTIQTAIYFVSNRCFILQRNKSGRETYQLSLLDDSDGPGTKKISEQNPGSILQQVQNMLSHFL